MLYVYATEDRNTGLPPVVFLDKYGNDWTLLLEDDVIGFTYMGNPILSTATVGTSTPSFGFRAPTSMPSYSTSTPMGPMPMPRPTPVSMPKPTSSFPRVSFLDHVLGPRSFAPSGMRPRAPAPSFASSGHTTGRG